MGLDPVELTKTVRSRRGEEPLPIHSKIHGLDIAPSNINLSAAELELVAVLMRDASGYIPISEHYDFILIDCPPGILSVISLVAATHVLVPIQTQFKVFRVQIYYTLAGLCLRANRHLAFGFIPQCTMVALHRRQHFQSDTVAAFPIS